MDFLSFLKKSPDARKVFGARELKIIEKQLLGVALTQSEKNRLSRDVRRKLEFMAAAAPFAGEFRLKKGSLVKQWVAEALEAVGLDRLYPSVRRVWLFGSTTEKKRTLRSDVDLAVEFDAISSREATAFRARVSGDLRGEVDVQVLNVLPALVRREVLAKGRLLYERKNKS